MGYYIKEDEWKVKGILLDRSDNAIKNRFYSRLRKGLKTINSQALEKLGNSYKQIKFTAIFKIIEATEDGYKDNRFC